MCAHQYTQYHTCIYVCAVCECVCVCVHWFSFFLFRNIVALNVVNVYANLWYGKAY